jgi:hypothetical protein
MQAANCANASSSVSGAGPASTGGAPASAVLPDELLVLLPLEPPELDAVPPLELPELAPLLLAVPPLLLPLLAVSPGW